MGDSFEGKVVVVTGASTGVGRAIARAFGAAVVLLLLVVIFFAAARVVGGKPPGHVSKRQQRRMAITAGLAPALNSINLASLEELEREEQGDHS